MLCADLFIYVVYMVCLGGFLVPSCFGAAGVRIADLVKSDSFLEFSSTLSKDSTRTARLSKVSTLMVPKQLAISWLSLVIIKQEQQEVVPKH